MKNIKTVSFSGELLEKMKAEGLSEEKKKILRDAAEEAMSSPRYSVVDRMMKAASGNIHDYSSIGTYWWPNPDTPDGLPYIRRDGETTPAAKDPISYDKMCQKAFVLALAAYYFDDATYAKASRDTIYDWHLNPETYMTPHAEYSQAIPGICTGRGIGVIDFSMRSFRIFDAVGILEAIGGIEPEVVAGLKEWYDDLADWLLTSENGLTEDTEPNNHGTYYDVHLIASAAFTGRAALLKKVCNTAYERRVRCQIEPGGEQPLELARTRALAYSLSNIRAMMLISDMAANAGYTEFWAYDEKYGDIAIKKAFDYIYPYCVNPETFPYQEIEYHTVLGSLYEMLIRMNAHFEGEGYDEKAEKLGVKADLGLWLTYPMK